MSRTSSCTGSAFLAGIAVLCVAALNSLESSLVAGDEPGAQTPRVRTEFARIKEFVANGEVARALEATEAELKVRPRHAWLLETAGRLAIAVGRFGEGREHFLKLAETVDDPAAVYLELALLEADAARRTDAAEAASWALGSDPRRVGPRAVIGRYQLFLKLYEQARDTLASWVATGAASREERAVHGRAVLRLGHFDEAVAILEESASGKEARREDRCALGEALIGAGRYQEAADALAALLQDEPRFPQAYYQLGTALARLRRRDTARLVLGRYREFVHLDESWASVRDVDSSGPRDWACLHRAKIFIECDDDRQAIEECVKAVAIDPMDGRLQRAAAVQLIELEALGEARTVLQRAVDAGLEPRSMLMATLGEVERRCGHTARARDLMEQALAIQPNNLSALIGRGQIAFESDEGVGRARNFFERGRRIAPGRWQPLYWLGRSRLEEGDVPRALDLLARARQSARVANANLNAWLAAAIVRAGDGEKALRLIENARRAGLVSSDLLEVQVEVLRERGVGERLDRASAQFEQMRAIDDLLRRMRAIAGGFNARGPALLEIGRLYRRAGLSNLGLRYLHLARAAAPESAEIYRELAATVGPEDPFMKAHALACLVRLQPRDSEARMAQALLFARLGVRLAEAEMLARDLLGAADTAAGHHVLGEVLLARGDREGAAREARQALSAEPEEKQYADLLERAESPSEEHRE